MLCRHVKLLEVPKSMSDADADVPCGWPDTGDTRSSVMPCNRWNSLAFYRVGRETSNLGTPLPEYQSAEISPRVPQNGKVRVTTWWSRSNRRGGRDNAQING